jgi:hypothetical protein
MLSILEKINETGEYCPTIKDIRQWCGILNAIVFEDKFPKFREIFIKDIGGQFAAVQPLTVIKTQKRTCSLEVGAKFKNFKFFITILAHEMIHAYQWVVLGIWLTHDRKTFFKWKQNLLSHGIELHVHYPRNKT